MLHEALKKNLDTIVERHEEISHLLGDARVLQDQNKFRNLSKEYAELEPVVLCFKQYNALLAALDSNQELLKDADPEIKELARSEMQALEQDLVQEGAKLQALLLPQDPYDKSNIYLEVRAGTGGEEAALFAADLMRMYIRYAESNRFTVEIVSESLSDHGGYKEVILRIIGQGAYSRLKFESGGHRVQRVPETESQGRVHTSACTVAILPEIEEIDSIEINPNDLRIDTFRASGAGGQHVNRTDSAVRITHIPTGLVVECQSDRSQHKNKSRAMGLLQAKILSAEQEKQKQAQADTRKSLVGSGDRSERIRTYNFPQGRVTDHRINVTIYRLPELMNGALGLLIEPLMQAHQADQLAAMSEHA
ncbi:MAG: peptide chain release factor 1 [Gammaproteobacteria bacterium]